MSDNENPPAPEPAGAREWTIRGQWFDDNGRPGFSGHAVNDCVGGPLLAQGEDVHVIEATLETRHAAELREMVRVLNRKLNTCGVRHTAAEELLAELAKESR